MRKDQTPSGHVHNDGGHYWELDYTQTMVNEYGKVLVEYPVYICSCGAVRWRPDGTGEVPV